MEYIAVDRKNLSISLTIEPPEGSFPIPTELKMLTRRLSPIESTVYYRVIYPAQHEEDRRKGVQPSEYLLAEPQPWMVAIAIIMWEAIIQGLTWDVTKAIVGAALRKLRIWGLAPYRNSFDRILSRVVRRVGRFGLRPADVVAKARSESSGKTELGFFWSEFGTDGSKLREMFIGLRRSKEKMTQEEIEAVSGTPPLIPDQDDETKTAAG